MGSLKGGTQLWNADSVAQNDVSTFAYIGPGPYVVVFIDGTDATHNGVFNIQVAGSADPHAGLNFLDTGVADGGVTWYDLVDSDGATLVALSVTAGQAKAFDLSPFGPTLLRLKRTDGNGTTAFSALVTSYGPN